MDVTRELLALLGALATWAGLVCLGYAVFLAVTAVRDLWRDRRRISS
jgi:hypothetical protein